MRGESRAGACVRDGGVMRAGGIMWSFFDFKLYSIFFFI